MEGCIARAATYQYRLGTDFDFFTCRYSYSTVTLTLKAGIREQTRFFIQCTPATTL
jgi:hypothetical protein